VFIVKRGPHDSPIGGAHRGPKAESGIPNQGSLIFAPCIIIKEKKNQGKLGGGIWSQVQGGLKVGNQHREGRERGKKVPLSQKNKTKGGG